MPNDATMVQDRAKLLKEALAALRTYDDDYHLMYPRLIARGISESRMAQELEAAGFGQRAPEIIEHHVETFLAKMPHVPKKERADILTEALARFDSEPRRHKVPRTAPQQPPSNDLARHTHRETAKPQRTPGPSLPVPAPEFPRPPEQPTETEVMHSMQAPSVKGAARPERRPFLSEEAPSRPESMGPVRRPSGVPPEPPAPPPRTNGPSDAELIARINALPPAQRKLLSFLGDQPAPPSREKVAEGVGIEPQSAQAYVSTLFTSLGLARPHGGVVSMDRWNLYRHLRIRHALTLEGIRPPRMAIRRKWGR